MELSFKPVSAKNFEAFHDIMLDYYCVAEDFDAPIDELHEFIETLFDMINQREISGRIIAADGENAGAVLWMLDKADSELSEMPGWGSILELSIAPDYRGRGIGEAAVDYAEGHMLQKGALGMYVSSCATALEFWKKCGYNDFGRTAHNGLPIFIKTIS